MIGGKASGKKTTHGGKRTGAGRPRIWSFDDILTVGQMCENRWRDAEAAAVMKNKAIKFSEQSEIGSHHRSARLVPIGDRSAWLNSEAGETHHDDVEVEIEFLNEAIFGEPSQNRVVSISNKPQWGTRKLILEEAATKFCIKVKEASNLWEAYRRFERE